MNWVECRPIETAPPVGTIEITFSCKESIAVMYAVLLPGPESKKRYIDNLIIKLSFFVNINTRQTSSNASSCITDLFMGVIVITITCATIFMAYTQYHLKGVSARAK